MENKFNKPEHFILSESFQDYVLGRNAEAVKSWEDWIDHHPEKMEEINEARSFLLSIQFKGYDLAREKYNQDLQKLIDSVYGDNIDSGKASLDSINLTWLLKVAAVIILFVAFGGAIYFMNASWTTSGVTQIHQITKSSGPGMKRTIQLPDGSMVKLNTSSTIKYPERFENFRKVSISGEAFFDVQRDESRPFIVQSNEMEVKVLGTSFNVNAYDHEKHIEVAVASGKVLVRPRSLKKGTVLAPNEMVSFNKTTQEIKKDLFDVEVIYGWKDGILKFRNSEFEDIVEQLEKWYGVEILVSDKLKIRKGYSGKFQDEALANVLKGISFSLGFEYSIQDDTVMIYEK